MGKGTLYQPLFHRFCMNVEIDYSSHAMQHLHSWTLSVTNSLFPLSWVVFQAQLYCLLFCFAGGMYFCFWYNSFSGYNQCNALWILKDCSEKISLNTITCSDIPALLLSVALLIVSWLNCMFGSLCFVPLCLNNFKLVSNITTSLSFRQISV